MQLCICTPVITFILNICIQNWNHEYHTFCEIIYLIQCGSKGDRQSVQNWTVNHWTSKAFTLWQMEVTLLLRESRGWPEAEHSPLTWRIYNLKCSVFLLLAYISCLTKDRQQQSCLLESILFFLVGLEWTVKSRRLCVLLDIIQAISKIHPKWRRSNPFHILWSIHSALTGSP